MPAILSKPLARLPLEEMVARGRRRCNASRAISVPISLVRPVVPLRCMEWPPQLDWPSYAAEVGVQDPEMAAYLFSLVDPLANTTCPDHDERIGALAASGFDALTVVFGLCLRRCKPSTAI